MNPRAQPIQREIVEFRRLLSWSQELSTYWVQTGETEIGYSDTHIDIVQVRHDVRLSRFLQPERDFEVWRRVALEGIRPSELARELDQQVDKVTAAEKTLTEVLYRLTLIDQGRDEEAYREPWSPAEGGGHLTAAKRTRDTFERVLGRYREARD